MERVFTQDRGRYKSGQLADYPLPTWKRFFPGFEAFTVPLAEALRLGAEKKKERANGKA